MSEKIPLISWNNQSISHATLGTVQLGMNYGIANTSGQPSVETANTILEAAHQSGITHLDTAQGYAESESIIGSLVSDSRPFQIITKCHPKLDPTNTGSISENFSSSLATLNTSCVWGLMLHNQDWLDHWNTLGPLLQGFKDAGKLKYLGASVYSVDRAIEALNNPDISFIQIPCNIWDRRMITGGVLEQAKSLNKLCFIRSIYLQGLLIMYPNEIQKKLPQAHSLAVVWESALQQTDVSPKEIAFHFAKNLGCPLVIEIGRAWCRERV